MKIYRDVGGLYLLVDGLGLRYMTVIQTRSFRAYLSAAGHRNLDDCFRQLTWLWNRALCKRRQAWDRDETSVSLYDQYKELTIMREDPEWSRFAVGVQRSTLKHLDDAFGAFFGA